jgi:DNA (cytosine-5)-methyltransferase 1
MLKYVELFAGAGGLSLGLDAAGFECAAHAEIQPHARAVLRHRWPDTPLLGDVCALSGGRKMKAWMRQRYRGVALLSGGSPCQDLSVAGKRAGLGGARSSLFFRQVRLWKVLQCPYFLWENVPGALSS